MLQIQIQILVYIYIYIYIYNIMNFPGTGGHRMLPSDREAYALEKLSGMAAVYRATASQLALALITV